MKLIFVLRPWVLRPWVPRPRVPRSWALRTWVLRCPALLCLYGGLLSGQQPPPQQPPPQQPPPPEASQQPTRAQASAPPVKIDNTPPGDIDNVAFSVRAFYWLGEGHFNLLTGTNGNSSNQFPYYPIPPGNSTLPTLGDTNKRTPGGMITFPAGKYNRLEVSFFQAQGNGTSTAPQNLSFFGQTIFSGDFLATSFRVRNAKVAWNYLTWPEPPETARLRIHTLWEFQYTSVQTVIDAPFETSATFTPAVGTLNIYYPSFGVEAEYAASKHFYFDSRISGFAFPHRSVIWDGEASGVARFGHIEVFGGIKAFHLKTSPQREEYVNGTMSGPYGGLRFVLR